MNRRNSCSVLYFAVVLFLLSSSFATPATANDDDAGYPGALLRHGGSARSLALGEAGVTLDGGPNSMFYNPANLMRTDKALGLSFMTFSNDLVGGYNYFALSMSRMYNGDSKPLNFLFGPNSAWGMMFLDMSIDGIVERSAGNELIDNDFGYYDQAFLMAFAHELVSSQGILDFGMNVKFVGQGINGSSSYDSSQWGMGVDVGLNYQPINPTLIKKIASLKLLLPLRLGLNIQNLISPEMGGLLEDGAGVDSEISEKLPTMVRTGFSYNLYNLLGEDTNLLLVGDLDWMLERGEGNGSRGMGTYLGCEGQLSMGGATLAPRLGYSSVGGEGKLAAGFGVGYPFKSVMMQFDFSQGFNKYLGDEQRIAFSIGLRGDRGAGYFRGDEYRKSAGSRGGELRKLAVYSPQHQVAAARILAATEDTINRVRYGQLIGGTYLARIQYQSMRSKFLTGNFARGQSEAADVVSAYEKVFEDSLNEVEDRDRISYGEAILVGVEGKSSRLPGNLDEVLQGRGSDFDEFNSERLYYLGVKNFIAENYLIAAGNFKESIEGGFERERGLLDLARFGHAQALLKLGNSPQAIAILTKLKTKSDAAGGHLMLNKGFPRVHPEPEVTKENPFGDGDLADNVLFALGRCYGTGEKARFMYASVVRFYPQSDLASAARKLVANPAYQESN